jgi:hypothetical protein
MLDKLHGYFSRCQLKIRKISEDYKTIVLFIEDNNTVPKMLITHMILEIQINGTEIFKKKIKVLLKSKNTDIKNYLDFEVIYE